MERDYDLCERSQDDSLVWRGSRVGEHSSEAPRTCNKNKQRVFRNIEQAGRLATKRIVVQIAFDEHRLGPRAEPLATEWLGSRLRG